MVVAVGCHVDPALVEPLGAQQEPAERPHPLAVEERARAQRHAQHGERHVLDLVARLHADVALLEVKDVADARMLPGGRLHLGGRYQLAPRREDEAGGRVGRAAARDCLACLEAQQQLVECVVLAQVSERRVAVAVEAHHLKPRDHQTGLVDPARRQVGPV